MPLRSLARKKPLAATRTRVRTKTPALTHISGTLTALAIVVIAATWFWWFHDSYSVSLQSPIVLSLRWPLVVSERDKSDEARQAQTDQKGRRLSAWQQYACKKFGADCRIALAIQRAENPQGRCEIYHYNSNGTLDWGYFQINTVHLKRPGLNLRDLLDCKANVDFAYRLYREQGGFTPWSTYNSGAYRKFYSTQ